MAHPHKKDASSATGAKLARMTRHYGTASASNIKPPAEKFKNMGEGLPEPSTGYGANYAMSNARSDKPARKSAAANPVPTYARGGRAGMHSHPTGGHIGGHATTAGIKVGHDGTHVKPKKVHGPVVSPHGSIGSKSKEGMHVHGAGGNVSGGHLGGMPDTPMGGKVSHRARGGRSTHKGAKGATHVNVIVAPHHGAGAPTPPPLPPQLAGGNHPVMAAPAAAAPPMGGPMPPGGAPMGGPPPGAPPMGAMMPRKRGGRTVEDNPNRIKEVMSEEGLIRKARGGGITLSGGADSGVARIEKMKSMESHPLKPQVV